MRDRLSEKSLANGINEAFPEADCPSRYLQHHYSNPGICLAISAALNGAALNRVTKSASRYRPLQELLQECAGCFPVGIIVVEFFPQCP